jgi:hypothetical protein
MTNRNNKSITKLPEVKIEITRLSISRIRDIKTLKIVIIIK